jgi:hypothetical protein
MVRHPDASGVLLSDRFGSPLAVGDRVVIPVKRSPVSGYRASSLSEGTITKLVPLMAHPNSLGQWHSTGPNSRVPMVREDQLGRSRPTEYLMPSDDLSKAFIINVDFHDGMPATVVPFGWNVIKVP